MVTATYTHSQQIIVLKRVDVLWALISLQEAGSTIAMQNLSQQVVAGTATTCTREWLFWGFTCTSGVVSTDQTLASASSGTLGANGGIGFTVKVGEPRYRLYLEARYHYAPTTRLNTQIIPITMGIRF